MIGVVGLGNMGYAIAERLIAEGESLTVWNRSTDRANGLNDVQIAQTPHEVAQSCDIIISVLANDTATQDVYFGESGLLSAELNGSVIVDMCTTTPARGIELQTAIQDKNGLFLECPVGGTIGPARDGMLLGLAGGTEAAFAKAQPALQKLTRRLEHFGPVGRGAAMKLAINLPLMVYWSALGEALQIAQKHGVDTSIALDVLSDSSGAIAAAKKRVPPIRNMIVDNDHGSTNFSFENAIKDMQLMISELQASGTTEPIVATALGRYKRAQQQGFKGFDCSLVAALDNQI